MPITGTDKALMYALSGVARSGATRSGYHSARLFVSIAGVQVATERDIDGEKALADSFTINEESNGPTTATLTKLGTPPINGSEVIATLGSINNSTRIFGGTILSSKQVDLGGPALPSHQMKLIDYTWQLNRVKVSGQYSGNTGTIAEAILPAGFTAYYIDPTLPDIDEITFTNEDADQAFNRLAKRAGAYWFIDYHKRLYFFIVADPNLTNPQPLTYDLASFRMEDFSYERDTSQQITRSVYGGGGSEALARIGADETIVPIADASDTWFEDSGGTFESGPNRSRYGRRFEGGGGTLVGPGTGPATAPVLELAAGTGVDTGDHDVTVVFKTAAGRSLPSPVATIEVGQLPAPSLAPTVGVPKFGPGPDPGAHQFAYTEVTSAGETTPSPLSAVVTTLAGVTDPAIAPVASAAANIGVGSLTPGDSFSYKYTYANAGGFETLPSPASSTIVVTASQRMQLDIPYSTNAAVSTIFVYQSENGGAGPWKRISTYLASGAGPFAGIQNYAPGGTLTIFDQGFVRGAAAPTVNEATSNTVPLTGIPPSTSPIVTSKNIYGTEAGGSQLKLIDSITPEATSYDVDTLDADLGADAPTTNTADANQIRALIPLGPTGTTDRELYMSQTLGGARTLALTVANNTALEGTITASNATLAGASAEPTSDTSGLTQENGQIAAGATEIDVASTVDANPDGGFAIIGNGSIAVRYAGIFDNTIIGIPSTGHGSITAPIGYNSQITWAPALMDVGILVDEFVRTAMTTNVSRALRLSTGTATDRLGMETALAFANAQDAVTLLLSRVGAVSGNVWVTIQTGAITPAGTVVATSELIDASTIGSSPQRVQFTFTDPLPVGGFRFVVLHGDYTRSDSVHVKWHGFDADNGLGHSGKAKEYDGTTVSNAVGILNGFRYEFIRSLSDSPILYAIRVGDLVNLLVTVDDTDAQAALSAILDPDDLLDGAAGIVEGYDSDGRVSLVEARARAAAKLTLQVDTLRNASYISYDTNIFKGRNQALAIDAPTSITDTLKIQRVTKTFEGPLVYPRCQVDASNRLYSFEDLLRTQREG